MEFNFIATTGSGKIERGTIEAASPQAAVAKLRSRDLSPITVESRKKGLGNVHVPIANRMGNGRVALLDKVIFARHLALMLRSGLALSEALDVLIDQTMSKRMKSVTSAIKKDIVNGGSLAASLQRYPRIFSGIFVGMVQVGEASGSLERNLEYAATMLEKDYDLKKKVVAALIYPIIILVATFFVAIAMTVFVLPKIVKMFETFKMTLPPATRVFLALARFLVADGWYVLIGIVIIAIGLRMLVKAKSTRPFFHRLNVHIPFLKSIIRNVNLARAMRMTAVLLKSGVTINDGLGITASAIDNAVYQKIFLDAVDSVKKGTSLAAAIGTNPLIPTMTSRMIAVGEKTGKLEENLFYLADFYEGEVDQATRNLSSIIGPVLMIVMGVILGLLAIAIISPIYQFSGNLGGGK
jgi:type IV pilus assembly protein PilC